MMNDWITSTPDRSTRWKAIWPAACGYSTGIKKGNMKGRVRAGPLSGRSKGILQQSTL